MQVSWTSSIFIPSFFYIHTSTAVVLANAMYDGTAIEEVLAFAAKKIDLDALPDKL